MGKVTISRLRTGHIDCNKYLHRIGKKNSAQCECGEPSQSVEHILLHCPMTPDSRNEASQANIRTITDLLYTQKGIQFALNIWDEHRSWKRAEAEAEREEAEEGEENVGREQWGWGEVEA